MKTINVPALVLLYALAGCSRGHGGDSVNPESVVAQLGLNLPAGTRVVGASATSERDGMIKAKLEMPQAEVAGFVAGANVQGLEPVDADLLGPDKGFWDPHRAALLRYGQTQLPGARFLHIAVDDSRQDAAVVYVMLHGT